MLLLLIILECCLKIVFSQPNSFDFFIAVQNQQQTYLSYLPYINTCYYQQSNMYPGSVSINPLDSTDLFNRLQYQGMIDFWTPSKDGLSLMYIFQQGIPGYSGYLLFNSPLIQIQRQLILFQLNSTNFTFYYVIPQLTQNMGLNITIKNVEQIQLSTQAWQIIGNCTINNSSNFAYLGGNTYLYVCGQLSQGFTFMPGRNSSSVKIYNLTQIGVGNYQLISNPDLYDQFNKLSVPFWNCAILANYENITDYLFFLRFNISNNSLIIIPEYKMNENIILILNRIWGYQTKKQINRWMNVYSLYNISSDFYFPGDVISVFVSENDVIFVESLTPKGKTYLCVFNGESDLYWNISFEGTVIYYGAELTFMYNKETNIIFTIQVQRPVYTINPLQFQQTTTNTLSSLNITIPCQQLNVSIFYTILWTSQEYPTGYIQLKNGQNIYSTDNAFGLQVSKNFLMIGPGFQLVANYISQIQVFIIDSQTIVINKNVIGIINVYYYSANQYNLILFTSASVISVGINGVHTLVKQPCGFDNITMAEPANINQYAIFSSEGLVCICQSNFRQCALAQGQSSKQIAMYGQQSLQLGPRQAGWTNLLSSSQVKLNLLTLVRKGYVVSILQNNSVVLINVKQNKIEDVLTMQCLHQNQTYGVIYNKQFYDPYLVLFCAGQSALIQFVIKNNNFMPQRIIPLYRFKTKNNQYTIRKARSFIFIQVDPNIVVYPILEQCCVLRLDVCDFTVSAIQQIINKRQILLTGFYGNVDVVALASNENSQYSSVFKLYLPSKWIIFNQSNFSQIVTQSEQVVINFQSPVYNFYSYYNLSITFDLTSSNLNFISILPQDKIVYFPTPNLTEETFPTYQTTILYNLSELVCGPIFFSLFSRHNKANKNFEVLQTDVMVRSKLIGNIGIQFLQIINPSNWNQQGISMNSLIILVSLQKMYVYSKIRNNIQMDFVTSINLPEKNCLYYLYQVINQTAVILNSNCQGLDYDLQTPLLQVNYIQKTNMFTYNYSYLPIPISLRDIYTIPLQNQTLIIGILQGPMESNTGRLVICQNLMCNPLYVSNYYSFLINYAAHINGSQYYVFSIDAQSIQIFISPQVQPNQKPIYPNYVVNYTQYIQQNYCSAMRVLNAGNNFSLGVLSCSSYYYYYEMDFISGQIRILKKFARFSQCALYDNYKPFVISSNDSQIDQRVKMIFAQCRQNDFNLKLQELYAVKTPSPVFTGFMQIFTITGPLGPNCSTDSISPTKIIPLSSSMDRSLFAVYKISGVHKFLYSQINGILIDNFVRPMPEIQLRFRPVHQNYNFPYLNFYVQNKYHLKMQTFKTGLEPQKQIRVIHIVTFALFLSANIVTVIFIIWFYAQNSQQKDIKSKIMQGYEQDYQQNENNEVNFKPQKIMQQMKKHRRGTTMVNGQVQLFFVKTKKNRNNTIKIKQDMLRFRQTINARKFSNFSHISKKFEIELQNQQLKK